MHKTKMKHTLNEACFCTGITSNTLFPCNSLMIVCNSFLHSGLPCAPNIVVLIISLQCFIYDTKCLATSNNPFFALVGTQPFYSSFQKCSRYWSAGIFLPLMLAVLTNLIVVPFEVASQNGTGKANSGFL